MYIHLNRSADVIIKTSSLKGGGGLHVIGEFKTSIF